MATRSTRWSGSRSAPTDYVTKPFDPRELLARVRSVLRRASIEMFSATLGHEVRRAAACSVLDTRRLFALDGSAVQLTG